MYGSIRLGGQALTKDDQDIIPVFRYWYLFGEIVFWEGFPKEAPLGRTFELLIALYFESCLILVLCDSINVKSKVITIVISEIFYLNHLHRIWTDIDL